MASNAYKWTKANDGGLMIGLVGADHVKFQGGITGRYQRMAQDEDLSCNSVILNPTLIDTRPSGSVSMESNLLSAASTLDDNGLSLQLRYIKKGIQAGTPESRESRNTGGVLPLRQYEHVNFHSFSSITVSFLSPLRGLRIVDGRYTGVYVDWRWCVVCL